LGCGAETNIPVFFLNTLGGADSYEFSNLDYEKTYSVERELGQKTSSYNALIPEYFSYSDKGRFVQSAKALVRRKVETVEQDKIIEWLSELSISPEVYISLKNYQQSFLMFVIVENSDSLIATTRGSRRLTFTFSDSHFQNTLKH
jgi:hypothetical protein